MDKKLETLSKAQIAAMPKHRDMWLDIGLRSGQPLPSGERMLELFGALYKEAGLPAPTEIHIEGSPLAGCKLATKMTGSSSPVFGSYGNLEAGWLSFYSFFLAETDVRGPERLISMMEIAKSNIGMFWPMERTVIVTPVPSQLHMRNGVLHNSNGPSIEYPDGFRLFHLNGVSFPEEMSSFITTPSNELNVTQVLGIKNVEQRAEVIKRVGLIKFLDKLNPRSIDKKDGYELLGVTIGNYPERIYLRMQNPSIDEVHIEAVHPDCKSVDQARRWRNFGEVGEAGEPFNNPLVLT